MEARLRPPRKIVLGDRNSRFRALGWATADILDADFLVNLRDGRLPWESGSIRILYTSHLIEHLDPEASAALFREIHRVLEPAGTARFACPDLAKIRRAYEREDLDFFLRPSVRAYLQDGIERLGFRKEAMLLHHNLLRTLASYGGTGEGPYAPAEVVAQNYVSMDRYAFADWCVSLLDPERLGLDEPWGHVNAWDYRKLECALRDAGFRQVRESSFRRSQVAELRDQRFDLARHRWISMYVEAGK
ncbi:MAG: methyltransferase domain-containing protein [Acidobacteriota bacterium]